MKNKGNAITAAPLLKNLYRQVSGGLLGLAVKSKLIGEIPQVDSPTIFPLAMTSHARMRPPNWTTI